MDNPSGILKTKRSMPIGIDDAIGIGTAAVGAANTLFNKYGGLFGHSPWYQALKVGEAQNQVNQQMAQWNMENVTKPVFNMENQEWQRRFNEQNREWQRQWMMQNQYNSPEEQLKRFMATGMNPAAFLEQGGASPVAAADGAVGSPTVNEAASQMAQPADLAKIHATVIEERARNAYAFNQEMQAIKQSIDNITEADFRAKELRAMGISMSLGEANIGKTEAERWQVLADMYGWSARGKQWLSEADKNVALTQEAIKRSKVLEEEYKNKILEGDILAQESDWMQFEKFFMLEETRSRYIKNMQEAGLSYAQARLCYEKQKTEIIQQSYMGAMKTGQDIANWSAQNAWQRDVEWTNRVWSKAIDFKENELNIDLKYLPEIKEKGLQQLQWGVAQQGIDATIGTGLKIVGAMNQTFSNIIDAYATFQTKGATQWKPFESLIKAESTPGYQTTTPSIYAY